MTVEKDISCPNCKSNIEVVYCKHCNENIFVKSTNTSIVNIKDTKYDIFIGRRNTTHHWGNPFTHLDYPTKAKIKVNTVKESVKAFEDWLLGNRYANVEPERRKWILKNMESVLKGKTLGCFCKPKPCHGDVYVKLLSEGNMAKYL